MGKPPRIVGRTSKKGREPWTGPAAPLPWLAPRHLPVVFTPRLAGARWGRVRQGSGRPPLPWSARARYAYVWSRSARGSWWEPHRRERLDRWWNGGGPMRYADELIPGRCCARPLRRLLARHGNLGKVWRKKKPAPQPPRFTWCPPLTRSFFGFSAGRTA